MNGNENKTMLNVKNHSSKGSTTTDATAEEQMAYSMVDLLEDNAQHVSAEVARSLSIARNQAVAQLAARQAQAARQQGVNQSGNTLQWFGSNVGHYFEQHRLMTLALIAITTLLAFFAIQQVGLNGNLEHSDAFLLASDLPPEAYADKGFDTWLDTTAD